MCGTPLLHVTTKQRFCHDCAKIRQRERDRKRKRRKRGTYKDPLWREQVQETGDKERYENRLRRLVDDYRYGARHSVNQAVIRQIKSIGKKLGYTKERIVADIDKDNCAKLKEYGTFKVYNVDCTSLNLSELIHCKYGTIDLAVCNPPLYHRRFFVATLPFLFSFRKAENVFS